MTVVAMDFSEEDADCTPRDVYTAECGCWWDARCNGEPCDKHRVKGGDRAEQ